MRRTRSRTIGADHDSFLDTMTNVVGILILIVALTQIGVGQTIADVKRRTLDPEAVSVEMLDEARQERDRAAADLEERRAEPEVDPVEARLELERLLREVDALMSQDAESQRQILRLRRVDREIADLSGELAKFEPDLRRQEDELAKLRGQLRSLPAAKKPPRLITLPSPSSARAAGKSMVTFVCKGGKLYPLHGDDIFEKVKKAVEGIKRSPIPKQTFDRLARRVNARQIGDRCFRLRMESGGSDFRPVLTYWFVLKPGAPGDRLARLDRPKSILHRELEELSHRLHWIHFFCFEDSFETYLAARAIVEREGYSAGWRPYAKGEKILGAMGPGIRTVSPVPD